MNNKFNLIAHLPILLGGADKLPQEVMMVPESTPIIRETQTQIANARSESKPFIISPNEDGSTNFETGEGGDLTSFSLKNTDGVLTGGSINLKTTTLESLKLGSEALGAECVLMQSQKESIVKDMLGCGFKENKVLTYSNMVDGDWVQIKLDMGVTPETPTFNSGYINGKPMSAEQTLELQTLYNKNTKTQSK